MAKKKARKLARSRDEHLRALVVHAAQDGVVGAIEHCHNFWRTGDGFKRYIDHQIEERSQAIVASVRTALREALLAAAWRPPKRKRKRDR